jgi:hypothetical protein
VPDDPLHAVGETFHVRVTRDARRDGGRENADLAELEPRLGALVRRTQMAGVDLRQQVREVRCRVAPAAEDAQRGDGACRAVVLAPARVAPLRVPWMGGPAAVRPERALEVGDDVVDRVTRALGRPRLGVEGAMPGAVVDGGCIHRVVGRPGGYQQLRGGSVPGQGFARPPGPLAASRRL